MVSMKINQTYENGLVQRLKVEESTWHKWVKMDVQILREIRSLGVPVFSVSTVYQSEITQNVT